MENSFKWTAENSACPASLYGIHSRLIENTSEECIPESGRVSVPLFIKRRLLCALRERRQGNPPLATEHRSLVSAARAGIISRSPAGHLRRIKPPKPIRATPSFEEFKAIVENIRSQKFNGHDAQESADFVEFLGLAGLGKAEAAALTQCDIDWKRDKIITFRHKTKSGFAVPIYPQLKPLILLRRRDHATK